MKLLLWLFLLQIPFPGPGRAPWGGGGASVSVANTSFNDSSCSGSSTCNYASKTLTTGRAYVVYFAYCTDPSCSTADMVPSVADGTNTYVEEAGATASFSNWHVHAFVAKNVTGGTYTVTLSKTGTGNFYYVNIWFVELSGASTTAPVDSSVTNSGTGTSATPSLTSAGNVSSSGEVILAWISGGSSLAVTGAFSLVDTVSAGNLGTNLIHPSPGATVTVSGTQTSAAYQFSMIGIKP